MPVFDIYQKDGWKAWGNALQNGTEGGNEIGRRYNSSEEICTPRNQMLVFLAGEDNLEYLVEFEVLKMVATHLSL